MFQNYADSIKVATGTLATNGIAHAVPVTDKISGFVSIFFQIATGIATLVSFYKSHKKQKENKNVTTPL